MSKEFEQFRCNSTLSKQIGEATLSRKAKAYARSEAYRLTWRIDAGLSCAFTWVDSPQGHRFWRKISGSLIEINKGLL